MESEEEEKEDEIRIVSKMIYNESHKKENHKVTTPYKTSEARAANESVARDVIIFFDRSLLAQITQ